MASKPKPPFRVEAVLPAPAHSYFLERDSAAFRSLLAKVGLSAAAAAGPHLLSAAPFWPGRLQATACSSRCSPGPAAVQLILQPAVPLHSVKQPPLRPVTPASSQAGAEDWAAGVRGCVARGRQYLCQDHYQARIRQLGKLIGAGCSSCVQCRLKPLLGRGFTDVGAALPGPTLGCRCLRAWPTSCSPPTSSSMTSSVRRGAVGGEVGAARLAGKQAQAASMCYDRRPLRLTHTPSHCRVQSGTNCQPALHHFHPHREPLPEGQAGCANDYDGGGGGRRRHLPPGRC